MPEDRYPTAVVREIDGQLVLDDPDALAVIRAVEKHNCKATLEEQADRVAHFKKRIAERGASPDDVVIVLLNMNDHNGKLLGDHLMPGQDAMWESMRAQGLVPFARGLAPRDFIEEAITLLDKDVGERLVSLKGKVAVLVMDHGVVEAFEAP